MTKEEHAKVLAALENSIAVGYDPFGAAKRHDEATAIMRKEPELISDAEISLMAQNDDPGDWMSLRFRDSWQEGYMKGFKAALLEKAR